MRRKLIIVLIFCLQSFFNYAQVKTTNGELLTPTPPMGWMTWNYFADNIHEKDIMEIADAMVSSDMLKAGYQYIFIADGGREAGINTTTLFLMQQNFHQVLNHWPMVILR